MRILMMKVKTQIDLDHSFLTISDIYVVVGAKDSLIIVDIDNITRLVGSLSLSCSLLLLMVTNKSFVLYSNCIN